MISIPPTPTTQISQLSYTRRITGMGPTFQERAHQITACPSCNRTMNQGSLRHHMLTVHREQPGIKNLTAPTNPTNQDDLLYINMAATSKIYAKCPIPHCRVPIKGWGGMHRHFQHRYPTNAIYNIREGYLPKCMQCGLQCRKTDQHLQSALCERGRIRSVFRQLQSQRNNILATKFVVNGTEIETVPEFKYLGQWLCFDDNDITAVLQNIHQARI